MPTNKTPVIAHIFETRFTAGTGTLSSDLVTFDDLADAMEAIGSTLNRGNLANFWKDFIRSPQLNAHWPTSVFEAGWTAEDGIGQGSRASFRFVGVPSGQATPFVEPPPPDRSLVDARARLQSLSIPAAAKGLGRSDENWLAQVCARLGVVEAHFATASSLVVTEVDFLQTGIKLREGEVDAAYRVGLDDGTQWLVAAEVKGRREKLWMPQVLRAAKALLQTEPGRSGDIAGVIPFAIRVIARSMVHTIEFGPDPSRGVLPVNSEMVFEFVPGVPGIG